MTLHSLVDFLMSVAWVALLCLAFAGWGAALVRASRLPAQAWSACLAIGIATMACLAGLLNLAHCLSASAVICTVGIGLLLALMLQAWPAWPWTADGTVATRLLVLLFFLITLFRLGATVHTQRYQNNDDLQAYLVFPEKIAQLHYLEGDPFSERRVTSTVGLNYGLQEFVLATRPLESVQMADRALGVLLLAGMAFPLARRFGLAPRQAAIFAAIAAFTPALMLNLTFVLLPLALFMAMLWFAAEIGTAPARSALLLGIVCGAIAGSKSTYLPAAVLFCVFACITLLWRRGAGAILRSIGSAAAGCLIVLAPWMVAMHRTAGTWLFPVLGRGVHFTAYHLAQNTSAIGSHSMVKVWAVVVPLGLLLAVQLWLFSKDKFSLAAMSLLAAAVISTYITGVGTGGASVRRYCYPFIVPALLAGILVALRPWPQVAPRKQMWLHAAAIVFGITLSLFIWTDGFTVEWKAAPQNVRLGLRPFSAVASMETDAEHRGHFKSIADEYSAMQQAIPQGAVVLESLRTPFVLDFKARRYYVADFPAAASPRPGWPVQGTGDDLASYLRGQGIGYLAYSYGDCAALNDAGMTESLHDPGLNPWTHSQYQLAVAAHRQYRQIAEHYPLLFDDGTIFVADLGHRLANPQHLLSNRPCWSP